MPNPRTFFSNGSRNALAWRIDPSGGPAIPLCQPKSTWFVRHCLSPQGLRFDTVRRSSAGWRKRFLPLMRRLSRLPERAPKRLSTRGLTDPTPPSGNTVNLPSRRCPTFLPGRPKGRIPADSIMDHAASNNANPQNPEGARAVNSGHLWPPCRGLDFDGLDGKIMDLQPACNQWLPPAIPAL